MSEGFSRIFRGIRPVDWVLAGALTALGVLLMLGNIQFEDAHAAGYAEAILLTADASDRRYVRIVMAGGRSMVLALHAGPIDFATLPFANVCELLQQVPLPVPAILGHSDSLGVIALEDLGDITLQAHLDTASRSEQRPCEWPEASSRRLPISVRIS